MRVVLVVVTVFTAPVPVIQTLNAQLTARVHDVGPLYDGSFTDPKPAIGINSSSSFHDGINLPDINISGANPTGGSPSLGLFVPGNGLLEYAYQAGQQFASWDGSTGKMITNVADTGSAVWTNAGADIAPYTMIRFTVTRDLVTGTASYDPIIAGTDSANVKKYDIINATFSGKPSFGPFAILSLPRIIDDETFEFLNSTLRLVRRSTCLVLTS